MSHKDTRIDLGKVIDQYFPPPDEIHWYDRENAFLKEGCLSSVYRTQQATEKSLSSSDRSRKKLAPVWCLKRSTCAPNQSYVNAPSELADLFFLDSQILKRSSMDFSLSNNAIACFATSFLASAVDIKLPLLHKHLKVDRSLSSLLHNFRIFRPHFYF